MCEIIGERKIFIQMMLRAIAILLCPFLPLSKALILGRQGIGINRRGDRSFSRKLCETFRPLSGFTKSCVRNVRQSKIIWELTEEAFGKLLFALDSDKERAGEKYEALRESLIKFLDWRGSLIPEELVDEAFNRVARKLEEGEIIQDLPAFCHGVARLIFLQSLAHPGNNQIQLENLPPIAAPEPVAPDVRRECFIHCLQELSAESRQLITDYYRDEKRQKINNRLSLAEKLGIPLNALRSRAQRVREKLEQCVMRCCKKSAS